MSYHHLIDNALLDLTFDSSHTAEAFNRQAGSFVKQRLLPMVEQVFDSVSVPGKTITIDKLELDLGTISGNDYLDQLQSKLKTVLSQQLHDLLNGHDNGQNSQMHVISERTSQWQQLEHYLLRGFMPWNFDQKRSDSDVTRWLEEAVTSNIADLLNLLNNHDRRDEIIQRLINQLGWQTLNKLDPRLTKKLNQQWLKGKNGQSHSYFAAITQGIVQASTKSLQPIWQQVLTLHPQVLLSILRYYGQQRRIRQTIARSFSTQMLLDILVLLEPLEHPFIQELINNAVIFSNAETAQGALNISGPDVNTEQVNDTKSHLWAFTLGFLLVERGSRFNRKSYLNSLIRQMAAHHNIGQQQMLESLMGALAQVPGESKLKTNMQTLLGELTDESFADPLNKQSLFDDTPANQTQVPVDKLLIADADIDDITKDSNNVFILWLTQALVEGDGKKLLPLWPQIIKKQAPLLDQLLRYHGQQSQVRSRIIKGFSDPMLKDVVVVLEPIEHQFVQQIIDKSNLIFAVQSEQPGETEKSLKANLWEFTLGFLLVERGSAFNQQSFMGSLVRKMAAHRNISYHEMLMSLHQSIDSISVDSSLKRKLQQVLGGLTQVEGLDVTGQAVDVNKVAGTVAEAADTLLLKQLSQALLDGDQQTVETLWIKVFEAHPKWLKTLLIEQGRQAMVRQLLVRSFSDETLMKVIILLAPTAQPFVQVMIQNVALFGVKPQLQNESLQNESQTAQHQQTPSLVSSDKKALKQSLWEFTLTYLLVERGGQFNKQSYLGSLIKQMASHRNMHYQSLLSAMLQTVQGIASIPGLAITQSLKSELLVVLTALARSETTTHSVEQKAEHRLQQSYQIYWQLKQWLTGATSQTGGKTFSQQLKTLQQQNPLLLQELLKGAHSRSVNWHKIAHVLTVAEQKLLIDAFISLTSSADKIAGNPFIQTLEQYFSQLTTESQKQRYLALIFTSLSQEDPVDLEAIFEAAEVMDGSLVVARANVQKAVKTPKVSEPDHVLAELVKMLPVNSSVTSSYFTSTQINQLKQVISQLLGTSSLALKQLVTPLLASKSMHKKLLEWFGPDILVRLIMLIKPSEFKALQPYAQVLTNAAFALRIGGAASGVEQLKWQFIIRYLFVQGSGFVMDSFVSGFVEYLSKHWHTPSSPFLKAMVKQLTVNTLPSQQSVTKTIVGKVTAMAIKADTPVVEPQQSGEKVYKTAFDIEDEGLEDDIQLLEKLFVGNAGLVLTIPYIPRLFSTLGLTSGKTFKTPEDQQTAIHLLQYMVTGEETAPEYQLVLNKLLCGVKTAKPVARDHALTDQQKSTIEGLLKAINQHWPPMRNTTLAGLRESFLARSGVLTYKDDFWLLEVEEKAFDMLLDQLPWSYSVVKTPWMDQAIHVSWR
jgi:hypothetical protein